MKQKLQKLTNFKISKFYYAQKLSKLNEILMTNTFYPL